jgi:beta-mannosidase
MCIAFYPYSSRIEIRIEGGADDCLKLFEALSSLSSSSMAISLDGVWQLSSAARRLFNIPITIPGDVHTALIAAGNIPDPYWATNEATVQWVGTVEWVISRTFQVPALSLFSAFVLVLELVDTFATVTINGRTALKASNSFQFYRPNIKPYLVEGTNTINVTFHVAQDEAKRRYNVLKADGNQYYPGSTNNQLPNMNLIRKAQFESGWDWGPCIVASGIYLPVKLIPIQHFDLKEVAVSQVWQVGSGRLDLEIDLVVYQATTAATKATIEWAGKSIQIEIPASAVGNTTIPYRIAIDNSLQRWTIWEFGEPKLYDLKVTVEGQTIAKKIGIRELIVETKGDQWGTSFVFMLNGRPVNAKGANLIPSDSIPSRMNATSYRGLLQAMKLANMNMVRRQRRPRGDLLGFSDEGPDQVLGEAVREV